MSLGDLHLSLSMPLFNHGIEDNHSPFLKRIVPTHVLMLIFKYLINKTHPFTFSHLRIRFYCKINYIPQNSQNIKNIISVTNACICLQLIIIYEISLLLLSHNLGDQIRIKANLNYRKHRNEKTISQLKRIFSRSRFMTPSNFSLSLFLLNLLPKFRSVSLEAIETFVAAKPQAAGAAARFKSSKTVTGAKAVATKAVATKTAAIAVMMMMMIGQHYLLWMLDMVLVVNHFWMIVFVMMMVMIVRNVLNHFHWLFDLMLYHFFFFDYQWLMMVMNGFHLCMRMFVMLLFHRNVYYDFLLSVTVSFCCI